MGWSGISLLFSGDFPCGKTAGTLRALERFSVCKPNEFMKKTTKFLATCALIAACFTLPAGHALAQDANQAQIQHVMKAAFDKPSAPLKVSPVVVQGEFAVAGWTQDGRGGRAVMHKEGGHWSIMVCGGDGLKDATALAMTGMPKASAEALAKALAVAEARLDPAILKQFAMFDGIVKVGAGHNAHQQPGHAAKP